MSRINRQKAKYRKLREEGKMRSITLLTRTHVIPLEKIPKEERAELLEEEKRTERFSYADVIEAIILKSEQAGGLAYKDIRLCDGIAVALEKAEAEKNGSDPVLLLEEAHYEFVKNKIQNFPWRRWSRFTGDFVDAILNADQVEVKPVEAPASET